MTEESTTEFPLALATPLGDWRVLYERVDIRGEFYRLNNCLRFLRGALSAMKVGVPFGVELWRPGRLGLAIQVEEPA